MTTQVFGIVHIFDVHVSSCRKQLYNLQFWIVLQLSRNKIVRDTTLRFRGSNCIEDVISAQSRPIL